MSRPVREGLVPFRGFRVWYRIVGEDSAGRTPLLVLHGGPGAAHDYLEPLEELAQSGRTVVFYDQLGCGRSDHPDDTSLWRAPLFVEEVGVVRRSLGLDRVHVLGHSWGGILGMLYALEQPAGLASLIVSDSPASIPQWVEEANRLRLELPADIQEALRKHEAAGTTMDDEYQEAVQVFYRRHVCRLDPWPDCVLRSFGQLGEDPRVYHTMNGPSEFHVIGNIKDLDITGRLGEIRVPTLLLSGRHDEATPAVVETVRRGIPGSEWVMFEDSSHMPHIEEPRRYRETVARFLERVEGAEASAS